MLRTRWAAIGAAVAVTLGAGGIGLVSATSPSDAVTFVPIEPCRLFDTRPAFQVGPRSSPLGPNETFTTQVTGDNGQCTGIPTTATGVGMNVTADAPTQATVLTIWGAGDRPNASSLNPTPGQPPTPNAVTSGLTATGQLNVWNAFGSVHVLVDIVGYYTDHNHDDRYYTEAEVDAAVDAAQAIAAHAEGGEITVVSSPTVVRSVTVDAPSAGTLLASSSVSGVLSTGDEMSCSLTTGASLDFDFAQYEGNQGGSSIAANVAGARGFDVAAGSTTTINLVCDATIGANITALRPQMTVLFVPS